MINWLPTRYHLSRFQPWTIPQCHHCTEVDTLDHLQRSSCNPVSSKYPATISAAITEYIEKHRTPENFQATFLLCINKTWLGGKEDINTTSPDWFGSPALHHGQQTIGWRLMSCGMLSTQWSKFLQQTLHKDKWRQCHTDLPEYTGPPRLQLLGPQPATNLTTPLKCSSQNILLNSTSPLHFSHKDGLEPSTQQYSSPA
jgi:hypothetical protein